MPMRIYPLDSLIAVYREAPGLLRLRSDSLQIQARDSQYACAALAAEAASGA